MRTWRLIMFAATWLTYAGFYLTRNNYSVAQPAFMAELGIDKETVGIIATSYLTVYAIGQFINGRLGDRFGSRIMIAIGFALTCTVSVGMGTVSAVGMMALLWGINGYAQSIGWPSVTKAMTNWTPLEIRGRTMGFWGTCYSVGAAAATALATFAMDLGGWRAAFWVPALISLPLGVVIVIIFKNHPSDAGLAEAPDEASKERSSRPLLEVLNLRVVTLGLSYFSLKFVRYTFFFWFGVYLVEHFQFSEVEAGYLQVPLPLAGPFGCIAGGWLSDRVFGARRAPAAVWMLGGLVLCLVGLLLVPANVTLVAIVYFGAGFFLYGPDMLISGTAAMDFGDEDAASTVAGFVNGMGSIGAAIQGLVVGVIAERFGWSAVFYVLIVMVALSAAVSATLWTARGKQ